MADSEARSITGLGRWTVVLLGLAVVIDVVAVVIGVAERELFGRIAAGTFTDAEAAASDNRTVMISVAQVAIYLVTGIVFIIWFHRAYKNLESWGTELPHKTGWAIGAWFVPILNLFRPKGIADAIWKASDSELSTPVGDAWSKDEAPVFMHVWWVTWILSFIAARFASTTTEDIQTVSDGISANTAGLVANGLSAIAGALAILFVKGATKRQELRMQKDDAPAPPPDFRAMTSSMPQD